MYTPIEMVIWGVYYTSFSGPHIWVAQVSDDVFHQDLEPQPPFDWKILYDLEIQSTTKIVGWCGMYCMFISWNGSGNSPDMGIKDVSARIGRRIRKKCSQFDDRIHSFVWVFQKKQQLIDVGAARSRQQPVRLKVSLAMHRLHTMPLGVVELIWWFPEIGVPPKSSIFMACSHIYTIHFGVITHSHFRKPPFEF